MPQVGWNKQEIQIQPKGLAMFGYGQWHHRAKGARTALFARSIVIQHDAQKPIILCCLDLGCVTYAIRQKALSLLSEFDWFDPMRLMLTATHTHSGPGGCAFEALYNMPTPGFVPEHVDRVAEAIYRSVSNAFATMQDTEVRYGQADFDPNIPVAWNRSIYAYNRNPDVQVRPKSETHLALDRQMNVVGFYQEGRLAALFSLFGVHATCLGNSLSNHDGDNKGYAAAHAEHVLTEQGVDSPVAIFAQATAGDVSPHFHGHQQLKVRKAIRGEAEYQYAKRNGEYQAVCAFDALQTALPLHIDQLEAVYQHIDLSDVDVDPQFSHGLKAKTSLPCHGTAFFAGTPVDGLGAAKPITMIMSSLAKRVRHARLKPNHPEHQYYRELYASQGNKDIVLEAGRRLLLGKKLDVVPSIADPLIAEINRQVKAGAIKESLLVPQVVPIQFLKIGELHLVCCPGEITTTAGKRLKQAVNDVLQVEEKRVLLASYCNDYMGYITTQEEYQVQAYEGGHTLYGQWTLAALQTKYQSLVKHWKAAQATLPDEAQPHQPPPQELNKRTNFGSIKTAVKA